MQNRKAGCYEVKDLYRIFEDKSEGDSWFYVAEQSGGVAFPQGATLQDVMRQLHEMTKIVQEEIFKKHERERKTVS